ncbi:hypothetical protein [Ralstonia pseudosolanacearum]|uniref:hypothetical protein n=1 Tax=Ralstonia pseudosolanacearum TaxID=1310165 RepID=UPI003CF042F3
MTAATTFIDRLALPAGQSRRHWLPAGTIIVTLEGRLMLEPPLRWLVHRPNRPRR